MSHLDVRVACAGCHQPVGSDVVLPFRCAQADAGDDADHLLFRTLPSSPGDSLWTDAGTFEPFLRYRHRLYSYAVARARGLSDAEFVQLVQDLDARIVQIDEATFTRTPLVRLGEVEAVLNLGSDSRLFGKVDATSVSGSHKARHLFGIMLTLLVRERLGDTVGRKPLAIASCGNAALAAAVVARAADWPLQVFVPPDAEAVVLDRLAKLGASVELCARQPGQAGDPTVLRFREAVVAGALPFCCQGNENGLTIEGGETLGYELVEQLHEQGARLDRLLVQVGGGALMSAIVQGLEHAVAVGALPALPRIHAVQTRGCYPLARAWENAAAAIEAEVDKCGCGEKLPGTTAPLPQRAAWLHRHFDNSCTDRVLERMRTHRSDFMWPWEEVPHSVAHGILDDETYDWRVLVEAMLRTGGWPIVIDDPTIVRARAYSRDATGVTISATGAAGLGGLLALRDGLSAGEHVALILSGRDR
jgi:threonine synthase